jgi:hypothetical protein
MLHAFWCTTYRLPGDLLSPMVQLTGRLASVPGGGVPVPLDEAGQLSVEDVPSGIDTSWR